MKKLTSALLAVGLLLALAGCGSTAPDPGTTTSFDPSTAAGTESTPAAQSLGEKKRFRLGNLSLVITNVAKVETQAVPYDFDDGATSDILVYTLLPGAQLIVESAGMLDGAFTEDGLPKAHWFVYSDLPDEEAGEGDTYIPIVDDMPPLTITSDMKSVFTGGGSVLVFKMQGETQS
ncbi:MAG: hypothetical protein LBB75_02520 [Oscillospiraceae bacterium]|jgi:hypothetical protein|nr:hypothetical protein [Oscillospiraceae bacterium]